MSGIRKVDPFNIHMLKHVYGIMSDYSETNSKKLTWEKFLECRDSTYIYMDKCYDSQYPIIDCIMACRRTYMEDIDIEDLEYYCKPYHILYSIEGLYVSDHHNPDKISDIVYQMIDILCKDKNDAFICLKIQGAENKCHRYISRLLSYGFTYIDYSKNIWTFIKSPTVNANRNN